MKNMIVRGAFAALFLPFLSGMFFTGCATHTETPMPPGAYVPEEENLPPEPPPAPDLTSGNESARPQEPDLLPQIGNEIESAQTPESESVSTSAPAPAVKRQAPKSIKYTVKKGDTLGGIAWHHHTTANKIADFNGMTLKSTIRPGNILYIPVDENTVVRSDVKTQSAPKHAVQSVKGAAVPAGDHVYVVKNGDTLGGIAVACGVRTSDLAALNNLDVRKPIFVGQKLAIPKNGTVPAAGKAVKAKASVTHSSSAKTVKESKKAVRDVEPKASVEKTSAIGIVDDVKTPSGTKAESGTATAPAGAVNADSADAILDSIDTGDAAAPVPPAAKPATDTKPAADAKTSGSSTVTSGAIAVKPSAPSGDETAVLTVNTDRAMTLKEAAEAYDRSIDAIKKLNPEINENAKMPAGSAIRIPIF